MSAPETNAAIYELNAAIGYMRNAMIDLEAGAPKATALRTIRGGIKRAEDYVRSVQPCEDCDGDGKVWNNADKTSGMWFPCDCGGAK